jgi:hypothetical protein
MEFTEEQRMAFLDRMRLGINMSPPVPKPGFVFLYVLNPTMRGKHSVPVDGVEAWPSYIALGPDCDDTLRQALGIVGEQVHPASLGRFVAFADVSMVLGFVTADKEHNRAAIHTCDFEYDTVATMWGPALAEFCASVAEHRIEQEEVYRGLRTYAHIVHEVAGVVLDIRQHRAVDLGEVSRARVVRGGSA